jgi:hypothetical protein
VANSLKKKSYYIDTIGSITVTAPSPIIMGIMVTPTATDSRVVIKESVSGVPVIDIKIASIESRYITFEAFGGILTTSTFEIATLTNIENVVLHGFWNLPVNKGGAV